ncbi:hypothetical protein ABEO75_07355 [Paenibacillus macerans]|uniref:hypothetical protein n=1 Tax=Paenibacillus macerans TaxID=44252 RepID=UPI002E20EC63|nr:hypothetical protein [Paenibacillus macerans]
MDYEEFASFVTNVGFPVAMCFILLRYVLQTIGKKLDKLDSSLIELSDAIKCIKQKE